MKKVFSKIKEIYNRDYPLRIEWIIAILIGFVMMLMFCYIDTKSLTIWSTNILDCIAKGDITKYYSYTASNNYGVYHQYVSGTLYSLIIWAIWNLPIWAIQFFGGVSIVNSAVLLIWSKLFLFIALVITLTVAYKICKELFKDKKMSMWIVYLSATFVYTYLGIFYAGQNDILICMFATLGLYNLIKEKNIWFYVFSAMAISIKYFFLLPYIPIILLLEKNIWRIAGKLLIGVSPIIIFKLLVFKFPMYALSEAKNHSDLIMKGFYTSGIKALNGGKISYFLIAYFVICFIAYITNPKTKEKLNNYVIYFTIAPTIVMAMFSTYYEFYRPILLMPALMILYGFKPKMFRINVILDTVMSCSSLGALILHAKFLFNFKQSINGTVLANAVDVSKASNTNLRDIAINMLGGNENGASMILANIMFASLAIMLVVNYPAFNEDKLNIKEGQKPERWIIWIRTLALVPCLALLLVNVF